MGLGITFGLGVFVVLASQRFLREKILSPWLPKAGEGPNKEKREKGYFNIFIHGENASVKVVGKQDPGYGETAKMLGEAALCLVQDQETIPALAGVLTPASAMGMVLIERLRAKDMEFSFKHNAEQQKEK